MKHQIRRLVIRLACLWPVLLVASTLPGGHDDLQWAEPAADVGIVLSGVPLTHAFVYKNTGSETIRILQVNVECGCTTPRLEMHEIGPGETGRLELEVRTLTQPAGLRSWPVRVVYQSKGAKKEIVLNLQATLVSEITVTPANMVVAADHVAEHPFLLTETRPEPIQIVEARTNLAGVRVHMEPCTRDNHSLWQRLLRLEVPADMPLGRHEARIDLYTTDPKYRHLQIPFTLVKQSLQQVSFAPREVEIAGTAGQSLPSRLVILRAQGAQEVEIEGVTADHPAIACRWISKPGAPATVRVLIDQRAVPAGGLDSAIHIRLRQPASETLTVPVSCKLSAPAGT